MQVSLGDVSARCTECGSTEFTAAEPGAELTHLSELICTTCEAPTTHAELIVQIGSEAMKRARSFLRGEASPSRSKRRKATRPVIMREYLICPHCNEPISLVVEARADGKPKKGH